MTLRAERVCASHCAVGESPIWCPHTSELMWVDIAGRAVHRLGADGAHSIHTTPETIGAIALAADGGLIAATGSGFARLGMPQGDAAVALEPLETMLADMPGMRMNDGALDRQGRFWAGSMLEPADAQRAQGALYSLDGMGCRRHRDGFVVQNGLAFSPDGGRMYFSDSHVSKRCVWVADYDGAAGRFDAVRVFADFAELGGRPDGAAIDTDGCYWIAATDSGRILRLTPEGRVDCAVEVPTSNPTKPCFGGPELKTLYITSLTPEAADAEAGNVFALEGTWQGVAETPFNG
ncbi:gluconolactonase [Devosia pacifica]|uniref:Gluconolactonase n=1 Tax=Devosia pacifica TaxID=1335967 RepID=A0A918VSB1_9HYPH|nr:SMP-30/gluconolactonase/LRE family protein [Devosia pacifica]GHA18280.1 gluconolactonase [Devosia pacifica]